MSIEYDEYLREHINNVNRSVHWLLDNIDLKSLGIDPVKVSHRMIFRPPHDQSKYDAEEYNAYDAYFYGGNKSYAVKQAFDYAWLDHIHKNPHHWQHWVLINDDDGQNRALEMPVEYVLEMIADWWSFSWKNDNLEEIFDWYADHKDKMILHPRTRKLVEGILNQMKEKIE